MRSREQHVANPDAELPKRRRAISGWAKVALVFGSGVLLVSAAVIPYLTINGFLPAASQLWDAKARYRESGAPVTTKEALAVYQVPKELNAALVVSNLSTADPFAGHPRSTPPEEERAKVRKKIWSRLVDSIDRYGLLPHYRPISYGVEFEDRPDLIGGYNDQMEFRSLQRALLEAALESLSTKRYEQTLQFVERAIIVERWGMDRPTLINKLIRLRNHTVYWELLGQIAENLEAFPKLDQSLKSLEKAEDADLRLDEVAKLQAFVITRFGADLNRFDKLEEAVLEFRKGRKTTADFGDQLFAKIASSRVGKSAFYAQSLELGNELYRAWAKTKDFERAMTAAKRKQDTRPNTEFQRLYAYLGLGLGTPGGTGLNKALYERSAFTKRLIKIASIVGKIKRTNRRTFKLSDLPEDLRTDIQGRGLQVRVVGNELRIYKVMNGKPSEFNLAKGHGFRLRL